MNKEACSYGSNRRKRGLPVGYVRVLEMLWGSVLGAINGSEEVATTLLKDMMTKRGEEWRSSVLDKWRTSGLLREVEHQLQTWDDPEKREISHEGDNGASSESELSEAPSVLGRWQLSEGLCLEETASDHNEVENTAGSEDTMAAKSDAAEVPSQSLSKSTPTLPIAATGATMTPESTHHPARLQPGIHNRTTEDRRSLPSNMWHLINVYFDYTHCWFPIIEKGDIYKVAHSFQVQSRDLTEKLHSTGSDAALWAILAFASRQDSAKHKTSHTKTTSQDAEASGRQFYITARDLIPSENGLFSIGHVQALLLLSLINCGAGAWSTAWILTGKAVRIAYEIGLCEPTRMNDPQASVDSFGRRTHVFFGCFILDTLISARLERPSHLRTNAIANIGLLLEDGIEEWSPWVTASGFQERHPWEAVQNQPVHITSTFNRLMQLVSILSDITCDGSASTISIAQYHNISRRLREWNETLPDYCQLPDPYYKELDENLRPLPHFLYLNILFASTATILELRSSIAGVCKDLPLVGSAQKEGTVSKHIEKLLECYSEAYNPITVFPLLELQAASAARHVNKFGAFSSTGTNAREAVPDILTKMVAQLKVVWSDNEGGIYRKPGISLPYHEFLSRNSPSLPPDSTSHNIGAQEADATPSSSKEVSFAPQPLPMNTMGQFIPNTAYDMSIQPDTFLNNSRSFLGPNYSPDITLPSLIQPPTESDIQTCEVEDYNDMVEQELHGDNTDWLFSQIVELYGSET